MLSGKSLVAAMALAMVLLGTASQVAFANPEQWRRAGFSTDFSKTAIDLDEIFSGGPPKDGIPSIDAPIFQQADTIDWISDNEPVIRLEIAGTVRAYPLKILIWHEIVNDVIADTPVSVTYCPLCNSSIAFDRRMKGQVLDFGTTGLLRNSDLVMYDRQTETWWQQFTGEAIVGSLTGRELKMIPTRVVGFGDFKNTTPKAEVLAIPRPVRRDYGRNPYVGYDSRSAPYPLFQGDLPDDVNPMARVVVVRDGDEVQAILLAHLRELGQTMLDNNLNVRWTAGQASILDSVDTTAGRDVGSVEVTRVSGGTTEQIVHDVTFAFVLNAFHPEVELVGVKGK